MKAKKKAIRGRPPMPPGAVRRRRLQALVTDGEWETLRAWAEREGESVSSLLAAVAIAAAERGRH